MGTHVASCGGVLEVQLEAERCVGVEVGDGVVQLLTNLVRDGALRRVTQNYLTVRCTFRGWVESIEDNFLDRYDKVCLLVTHGSTRQGGAIT